MGMAILRPPSNWCSRSKTLALSLAGQKRREGETSRQKDADEKRNSLDSLLCKSIVRSYIRIWWQKAEDEIPSAWKKPKCRLSRTKQIIIYKQIRN